MTHRRSLATLAALTVLVTLALVTLALVTPALAAPPETPVIEPATGVTATEATLHGELNPGASSEEVEYHFTYGAGSCEGTNAPEPPLTASGNHTKVSQPITALVPNTEYLSCLVATTIGSEPESQTSEPSAAFKTQSLAPAIDSEAASNVSPIKATLEAQVNPNNEPTTCTFEYGTTTTYDKTAPCDQGTLEGFGDQGATTTAALEPVTTYHFRVVVENPTGKTEGNDTEFTTPAKTAPLIDSEAASSITPFTANLEAQINPDDQLTTSSFEYATNEALTGAITVPGEPELAGFGDQGVSAAITGLTLGTTYYYRATANNETGPTTGPVQSFTTIPLPSVDDIAPTVSAITHRQAKLTGTVDPGGAATTYHFEYGPTTAYGVSTPETPAGEGVGDVTVGPQTLNELTPATVYHYRLVAISAAGTSHGTDHTFMTEAPLAPFVTTGAASGVGASSATISGTIDPRGFQSAYEFDLGVDTSYGSRIFGTGGSEGLETVSLALGSLTPGTTYHYRLCASNLDGTACGSDQTFSTPGSSFPLAGVASSNLITFPASILAELAAAQANGVTGSTPPPKPLTKAQKLKRALKACSKKRKAKRAACRRAAKKRYR
jgi:hypothetical protein